MTCANPPLSSASMPASSARASSPVGRRSSYCTSTTISNCVRLSSSSMSKRRKISRSCFGAGEEAAAAGSLVVGVGLVGRRRCTSARRAYLARSLEEWPAQGRSSRRCGQPKGSAPRRRDHPRGSAPRRRGQPKGGTPWRRSHPRGHALPGGAASPGAELPAARPSYGHAPRRRGQPRGGPPRRRSHRRGTPSPEARPAQGRSSPPARATQGRAPLRHIGTI